MIFSGEKRGLGRGSMKKKDSQREDVIAQSQAIEQSKEVAEPASKASRESKGEVHFLILDALKNNNLEQITRLLDLCVLPKDFFTSPEIQKAAFDAFTRKAEGHSFEDALRIAELFYLSPDEINKIKKEIMKKELQKEIQGWIDQEMLNIKLIENDAAFNSFFTEKFIKYCKSFLLSDEEISTIVADMFIELRIRVISLRDDDDSRDIVQDGMLRFFDEFRKVDQLGPEEITGAKTRKIERYLDLGQIDQAVEFMYEFTIPRTWRTPEVRQAMKQSLSEVGSGEERSVQIAGLFIKDWLQT